MLVKSYTATFILVNLKDFRHDTEIYSYKHIGELKKYRSDKNSKFDIICGKARKALVYHYIKCIIFFPRRVIMRKMYIWS